MKASKHYISNFRAEGPLDPKVPYGGAHHASRITFHVSRPAILLLLLLAFCLRTYQLDSQSLRGDEAATVLYSAMPVTELWELSRVTDPHPPLYYLILHPWQWLAGESAWAMRFAGVTASVLAVAALYTLARLTLRSTGISLLAAALLTINPLQIWLAQDIRSYPFFTLLGLLSSWALWHALGGRPAANDRRPVANDQRPTTGDRRPDTQTPSRFTFQSRRPPRAEGPLWVGVSRFTFHVSRFTPWLLYLLITLACFYIHYYTVFLITFQGLFVLINYRQFWPQKWPWFISQVGLGLLMLPGLQLAYNFVGQAAGGIDTLPTPTILRLAATTLLTGFTLDETWGGWASLLLAAVWLIGLLALLRRDRVTGVFWTLFFAIPVLGVIALSIDRPFFKERFLIQAQPAFELLLAAGFLALWRLTTGDRRPVIGDQQPKFQSRRPPVGVSEPEAPYGRFTFPISHLPSPISRLLPTLLLLFLLAVNFLALRNYFADPAYAKAPPWQFYHDYVSDHAQPGDVMLTNFPEAAVSYYSPNELPFYVVPVERDRSLEFRVEQTEQIAGAYRRLWFLPLLRQGFDEQGDVLTWLDHHADRVHQVFFPSYHLNLYLTPPTIDTLMISQPATFAHGLRLRGYQIFDKEGDSRLKPMTSAENGQSLATLTPPGGDQPGYLLTLQPEDEFTLSLYWLAAGPTDLPYTVFTHLIAADGFNRASQDNQPVWGTYPTTDWQANEQITDKYSLTIPAGTPPGDHYLQIGWYDSTTQERVPLLLELPDTSNEMQPPADYLTLNVIIRVQAIDN